MVSGILVMLVAFYLVPENSVLKASDCLLVLVLLTFKLPQLVRERDSYLHPILISSFVLTMYLSLTWFWGSDRSLSGWFYYAQPVVGIAGWLLACAWCAVNRPGLFNRLPTVVVWAGTLSLIVTLAVYFSRLDIVHVLPRMEGLDAARNELVAAQLFGTFGILSYVIDRAHGSESFISPYFLATVFSFIGVLLTQSRGPIGFMLLTIGAVILYYRPQPSIVFLQIVIVLCIFLGVVLIWPEVITYAQQRGISWSRRNMIWTAEFRRFLSSPLWGIGLHSGVFHRTPDGFLYEHSHNSWLDMMKSGGLIALGLSLWNLFACVKDVRSGRTIAPYYFWLLFGCLGAFTTGKSLLTLPGWMWIFYWMPVGLIYGYQVSVAIKKRNAAGVSPGRVNDAASFSLCECTSDIGDTSTVQ